MFNTENGALQENSKARILILKAHGDQNDSLITNCLAQRFKFHVVELEDFHDASKLGDGYDCAILLLTSEHRTWIHCIDRLKGNSHSHSFPVIGVIASIEGPDVTRICESALDDIILIPDDAERIGEKIDGLIRFKRLNEVHMEVFLHYCDGKLIGKAPVFVQAIEHIPQISQSNSPVLISGETGVGKELCARAIHYMGPRSGQPFIPVNCGALHHELFDDELFGHVRGAFTGASSARFGMIHTANGGTLFLDEVNTLSFIGQVKLLRFLDDKKYHVLGSSTFEEANVRIIGATNVDLWKAVREGTFREDLWYRIKVLNIILPPLRARGNDILLLAEHFLEECGQSYGRTATRLSASAKDRLLQWHWPGNARELKNIIEKAVVMCSSNIIRAQDLEVEDQTRPSEDSSARSFQEEKELATRDFEKRYLTHVLSENNWNVTKAARQAHKERRSFYRLMAKHKLS